MLAKQFNVTANKPSSVNAKKLMQQLLSASWIFSVVVKLSTEEKVVAFSWWQKLTKKQHRKKCTPTRGSR